MSFFHKNEVREISKSDKCVKISITQNKTSVFKISKDYVAPSEYKAAYDKSLYPRTVFGRSDDSVRNSVIKKFFIKSPKDKVDEAKGTTPFIHVSSKKLEKRSKPYSVSFVKGADKESENCANKENKNPTNNNTRSESGKLPNSIANKIFKVNII